MKSRTLAPAEISEGEAKSFTYHLAPAPRHCEALSGIFLHHAENCERSQSASLLPRHGLHLHAELALGSTFLDCMENAPLSCRAIPDA